MSDTRFQQPQSAEYQQPVEMPVLTLWQPSLGRWRSMPSTPDSASANAPPDFAALAARTPWSTAQWQEAWDVTVAGWEPHELASAWQAVLNMSDAMQLSFDPTSMARQFADLKEAWASGRL